MAVAFCIWEIKGRASVLLVGSYVIPPISDTAEYMMRESIPITEKNYLIMDEMI